MNCDDLLRRIAEGRALDAEAKQHLAQCPDCEALLAWQSSVQVTATPSPERLAEIEKQITRHWHPVRRIPSNTTLVLALLALFFALAIGAPALLGYFALHALRPFQMALYYGALAIGTAGAAIVVVQLMIPGSKVRLNPRIAIPAIAVVIVSIVALLFPNFNAAYLHGGMRCFWNGLIAAGIAAILFATVLRRLFPSAPVTAAAAIGFFAGLCGVTVLALHCPVLVSIHILFWHLGVLVVSTLAGAIIGYITEWVSPKNLVAYRNS